MRYFGVTKVMIPWTDTEGMRQWSILTFSGDGVNRRRIWREIRKFAARNFNKSVPNLWIRSLQIINTYDPRKPIMDDPRKNQMIEDFIKRMEMDETETGANSSDQSIDAEETAGRKMFAVPDTSA